MASQIHATEHRVVEGAVRSRGLRPRERLMLEAVECLGEMVGMWKMLCSELASHLALRTWELQWGGRGGTTLRT